MRTRLKFIFSIFLVCVVCSNAVLGKSLWLTRGANERGMFADRVACKVGDILTVELNETTTQETTLKTTTDKTASLVGKVTSWLFPSSGFGKHGGEYPSTSMSLDKDSYTGGGEVKNKSTLQATGSAVVIDVLPNGNLVIEGKREVFFSGERQTMVLRGIVRADDVTTNNTVNGKLIADAQLEIIGEGAVSSAEKKGWLLKFKDFINPF